MVSIGSLPASRSRMNTPPKIFSFQRAYMRCLISSVKAFASLGESFFPISSSRGGDVIAFRFLPVCVGLNDPYSGIGTETPRAQKIFPGTPLKVGASFRYAFFQFSSVFLSERRA